GSFCPVISLRPSTVVWQGMISLASRQSAMLVTSWKGHALCLTVPLLILKKVLSGGKVIAPWPALTLFQFRLQRNVASFKAGQGNGQQKRYSQYWVRRRLCAWTALSLQKISCEVFRHTRRCSMNIQNFVVRLNF